MSIEQEIQTIERISQVIENSSATKATRLREVSRLATLLETPGIREKMIAGASQPDYWERDKSVALGMVHRYFGKD